MLSALLYLNSLVGYIFYRRVVWKVSIIAMLHKSSVFNANSVDPDQTPCLNQPR